MRRHVVNPAVVVLAGTVMLMSSPAGAGALTGGTDAGAVGAQLDSVSCASAGNCSAGGMYFLSSGHSQAFVAGEAHGVWSRAEEVPGTSALNTAGGAEVRSVSCVSLGNCGAGGYYTGNAHTPADQQAFVVSEVNGVWGKAEEVPGLAALNTGYTAEIGKVSCGAVGNCSAGGTYDDNSLREHAFVVSEVNGVWGKAEQIPGTTSGELDALSCTSAGACGAGGFDTTGAFVASEVNGVWGKAAQIPGLATLDQGHDGSVGALSCTSAGTCGADGFYSDKAGNLLAFAASEVKGVWGQAKPIPGATAPPYTMVEPDSLSCTSAGDCSTGGQFGPSTGSQAFVASEASGVWSRVSMVPGSGALNTGDEAQVSAVSCATAGNCGAGGTYVTTTQGGYETFVVSQSKGTWSKAEEVPGFATLNKGFLAGLTSMSCDPGANCAAVGYYSDNAGNYQAFVLSEVNGTWSQAQELHPPAP